MEKYQDKLRGMLIGLAIGDALGAPVEFKTRGRFDEIKTYISGGPFNLPAGYWTDDTSMALCLADSIIAKQKYDSFDVMSRYSKWIQEGYRSSTGKCFDVGNQISKSVSKYLQTPIVSADEQRVESAGNGCVMRLAPVVIASISSGKNIIDTERYSMISARETHYSVVAEHVTGIFGGLLQMVITGSTKDDIKTLISNLIKNKSSQIQSWQNLWEKNIDEIKPTGYVVDTVEAALWSFLTTSSFQEGALKAVNLGGDSDTIGAVYGQLAGGYYGHSNIPKDWTENLFMHEDILNLADQLSQVKTYGFSYKDSRFEIDKSGPGYSDERFTDHPYNSK
jgi:ADP-ribosyl-[dinitrogen reductase] hydrolase